MSRYPWPASALGKDEMRKLYEVSRETVKPITLLLREALRKGSFLLTKPSQLSTNYLIPIKKKCPIFDRGSGASAIDEITSKI